MLDAIQEIGARLTVHEFMLEVVLANQLAQASESESKQALKALVDRMAVPYTGLSREEAEAEQLSEIGLLAAEMAKRFVAKVAEREADIRASTPRGRDVR